MRPWVGVLILGTIATGVVAALVLIFATGNPPFTEEPPPPGHGHRPHVQLTDVQLSKEVGHEVSGCAKRFWPNGRTLYKCDGESIVVPPKGRPHVIRR